MNQDKHLFQFTGQQIADACAAEVAYRKERLAYWETEQAAQVERTKGLTAIVKVREEAVTGGKRYQVYADIVDLQDIQSRLYTCGGKIDGHQKAIEEYSLKGAAYATQPARAYELDPADVAYFKLNGAKRSD
jgi:hypothetical protein